MTSPAITVLLVTMDRRDLLEIGLWYLYETCDVGVEADVWIWDNASTDDTPDFLGTLVGWPGVRVFRSRENVGLAGAHQRMLPHVRTPYVFTLDDDVWMINRGWAGAVVRVLDADPSVHQLAVPPTCAHATNNYGVVHEQLDRPFFRVPLVPPQPRAQVEDIQSPDRAVMVRDVPNARAIDVAGERVIVPVEGTQLPFSVSGCSAAWRVSDLLSLPRDRRHPVVDLREAWGFPLQQRGRREATIVGYGVWHACPGPLWHIGRGERYWERRCGFAEAIYGRPAEEQRSWLERARRASGWGRPIEDAAVLG